MRKIIEDPSASDLAQELEAALSLFLVRLQREGKLLTAELRKERKARGYAGPENDKRWEDQILQYNDELLHKQQRLSEINTAISLLQTELNHRWPHLMDMIEGIEMLGPR